MTCIFCAIATGAVAADIVYQDDLVVAFRDIAPQAPVHILVIPRRHLATLNELDGAATELAGHLLATTVRLAAEQGLAESGYRTVMNCNEHGGQTVYHLHLHLLGGRPLRWPPG